MWDDENNLRLLREATYYYLYRSAGRSGREGGKSFLDLAKEIVDGPTADVEQNKSTNSHRASQEVSTTYQALRRFMYHETRVFRSRLFLDKLSAHLIKWFQERSNGGELARSHLIYQLEHSGWLPEPRSDRPSNISELSPEEPDPFALAAVDMFKAFFGTSDREFELAAKSLTGRERCSGSTPTDDDRSFFETYRYSSKPGEIIRTFTIVTPPSEKYPYCSFRNIYNLDNTGTTKESRGVAVRLSSGIYMLGKIENGDAIKLFVFDQFMTKASLNSGLIVTTDEHGKPVASRVAFQQTALVHSEDIGPSVVDFEQASDLDDQILRRLRNYIEFELGDRLTMAGSKTNQEHISMSRMVDWIGRHCQGTFFINGQEINPASHDHYPFNQALLIYDSRER